MPVYMNSGKIVAGGRVDGDSKVLQEVLADLKRTLNGHFSRPAETDPHVIICLFQDYKDI